MNRLCRTCIGHVLTQAALAAGLAAAALAGTSAAATSGPPPDAIASFHLRSPGFALDALPDQNSDPPLPPGRQPAPAQPQPGFVARSVRRVLRDQKEIFTAPLKPSNLKWDALFLAGTAALLATDRRTSRALPDTHLNISRDISNIGLAGTSVATGAVWFRGRYQGHDRLHETGDLELETLTNTLIVYSAMQFLAGRERPAEGAGHGRFWQHHRLDSSFPSGHAMFTWSMATVLAHEYPKPWVEWLAYGTALSVTATRWTGREHFASDVAVGTVLGYLIGSHIFHSHCRPGLSPSCHAR